MAATRGRFEGEPAARAVIAGRRVAWVARGGSTGGSPGGGSAAAVALEALRARIEADPASLEDAARGGAALALVPFEACAAEGGPPAPVLAVSVGDAVVRGVPTAARATVTGRAPERAGVTEAQVGGGFARAMAAAGLDVLVVSGTGPAARIRLLAEAPPAVEALGDVPAERGIPERAAALLAEGECGLLVGPGADLGLSFANVASVDGPRDRAPSYVGRGGLGATFARAGVVAIVAEGEGAAPVPGGDDPGLLALLRRSPRLAARAARSRAGARARGTAAAAARRRAGGSSTSPAVARSAAGSRRCGRRSGAGTRWHSWSAATRSGSTRSRPRRSSAARRPATSSTRDHPRGSERRRGRRREGRPGPTSRSPAISRRPSAWP